MVYYPLFWAVSIYNYACFGGDMKKTIAGLIVVFIAIALLLGNVYAQELPIVTAIEVKGLRRIEEGAIRARLLQKIGEPLAPEKTAEDIKIIFGMGYFDDVKVEIETFEGGIKVIYSVQEKPTVIRVDFQGNKKFRDSKLREQITLTPGAIADITLINDNAIKLRTFYESEGYYLASVVPVIKKVTDAEVAVTYQIEEGERVKIREVRIEGNENISDRKIRSAITTTERGLFSFITSKGFYKGDVMRADIEKIKDLYYNNGFIQVTVREPDIQLTDDRTGMIITIYISEGEQFKVSSVDIAGNEAFSEDELRKLIRLSPHMIFSKEVMSKDISAIIDIYSNNGYPLITVSPDLIPDEEKKEVRVTYRIHEGAKHRIGRIEITGNIRTRDKVIRREIRLVEADVFNASALRRSHERITNLQFFETVDILPRPRHEENIVDIDVKVKERPTGFLSIGGGYSSVDGFIVMADITQANLFGRGQYIRLRGELGGKSTFYELSFREPWFMGKPVSFGTSIYRLTREYGNFNRRATGFDVNFGKSFKEYWAASIGYGFEEVTIYNVREDASQIVREQEGTRTTSSISLSVARDTRDNFLTPRRGSRNAAHVTFAGLGGTNAFLKGIYDSGWFFPVFDASTFHLRGRVGYATGLFNEKLPIYERYYVGGIHTVRGLDYGEAGPKDKVTGEPLGGEKQLIFNAEYIFPIFPELRLKGVAFFDAGRAYAAGETLGSDLRFTTGAGVRWISPMGPIRIEWGYNLDRRPGEPSSRVEFTFGTFF
jgi:outer membrane protein insertion porin family